MGFILKSGNSLIFVYMMTNPKGMDKLFGGKEFEDVVNWTK
jgi:hypothetical protein